MCYKKPGPRCSSSAAKALIEAKSLVRAKGGGDFEAREALEEAQLEYDATPAGMKELERRIKQASNSHNSSQKTEYELRLNLGKAKRQERLDLIKEIDRGDVRNHNDSQEAVFPEIFHRFSQEGEEHHPPLSNKQLRDLISDCNHYTNKLDADELEALSWFTSNGSSIMNRFIATRDADFQLRDYRDDESFDEFDAREAEEKERYLQSLARTEHELESALQKAKRETPLRVFRGINADHLEREGYDDEAERYIRDKYKVGGSITLPTYASGTLDYGVANGFASGDVTLEILGKTLAPVSNISAWGVKEQEYVISPNVSYKVRGVRSKPTQWGGTEYIVQLEEE